MEGSHASSSDTNSGYYPGRSKRRKYPLLPPSSFDNLSTRSGHCHSYAWHSYNSYYSTGDYKCPLGTYDSSFPFDPDIPWVQQLYDTQVRQVVCAQPDPAHSASDHSTLGSWCHKLINNVPSPGQAASVNAPSVAAAKQPTLGRMQEESRIEMLNVDLDIEVYDSLSGDGDRVAVELVYVYDEANPQADVYDQHMPYSINSCGSAYSQNFPLAGSLNFDREVIVKRWDFSSTEKESGSLAGARMHGSNVPAAVVDPSTGILNYPTSYTELPIQDNAVAPWTSQLASHYWQPELHFKYGVRAINNYWNGRNPQPITQLFETSNPSTTIGHIRETVPLNLLAEFWRPGDEPYNAGHYAGSNLKNGSLWLRFRSTQIYPYIDASSRAPMTPLSLGQVQATLNWRALPPK